MSLDGLPPDHLRVLLDGLPVFERHGLLLNYVTVQINSEASVRALSLEDTVGLKARAWHDRFVIRDIIDLYAVAGTFSHADFENLCPPS
jgi:Nucleotidyl transferase AbiEii toxin, Type IV TA system